MNARRLDKQTELFDADIASPSNPSKSPPKGEDRDLANSKLWIWRDWEELGGPLFEGLPIPPPFEGGGINAPLTAAWMNVAEFLLSYGWNRPTLIAKWGGPSIMTWSRYTTEIRERWAQSLRPASRGHRREKLYREAEAVAAECWRRLHDQKKPPGHRDAAGLLRVVLDANKRRAALIGADEGVEAPSMVLNVDASTKTVNVVQVVMDRFGITREDLEAAGPALSTALTARAYKQLEEDES